jgi:hypothetical protein
MKPDEAQGVHILGGTHDVHHKGGDLHVHHQGGTLHIHAKDGTVTQIDTPPVATGEGAGQDIEDSPNTDTSMKPAAKPGKGNKSTKGVKSMADVKAYSKKKYGF